MKKFFAILGAFVVALSWLLIPVFSNDNYAKADSVATYYDYTSSDTYIISSLIGGTQQIPLLFSGNHRYNGSFSTNLNCYYAYATNGYSYVDYYNLNYIQCYVVGSSTPVVGNSSTYFNLNYATRYIFYMRPVSTDSKSCEIGVYVDTDFNANIYKVTLGKASTSPVFPNGISDKSLVNITYYDVEDRALTFSVLCSTNFTFVSRTYYLVGAEDFTDNQMYNQGYNQGLLDNQQNVYDNGYSAGNTAGYSNGYNAGINAANQYTFFNLFGSVLDAPVSVLMGILNFNLLGINLWALFTGLLTLAVLIFVIKLFIGGK